jgi:hypothetical protein
MRVHLSDGSDETRYGAQQIEILTNGPMDLMKLDTALSKLRS